MAGAMTTSHLAVFGIGIVFNSLRNAIDRPFLSANALNFSGILTHALHMLKPGQFGGLVHSEATLIATQVVEVFSEPRDRDPRQDDVFLIGIVAAARVRDAGFRIQDLAPKVTSTCLSTCRGTGRDQPGWPFEAPRFLGRCPAAEVSAAGLLAL